MGKHFSSHFLKIGIINPMNFGLKFKFSPLVQSSTHAKHGITTFFFPKNLLNSSLNPNIALVLNKYYEVYICEKFICLIAILIFYVCYIQMKISTGFLKHNIIFQPKKKPLNSFFLKKQIILKIKINLHADFFLFCLVYVLQLHVHEILLLIESIVATAKSILKSAASCLHIYVLGTIYIYWPL